MFGFGLSGGAPQERGTQVRAWTKLLPRKGQSGWLIPTVAPPERLNGGLIYIISAEVIEAADP